jgi:hypothetical protein
MSYDNTNRGQVWPNSKKEKETHPDFTGTVDVEGVEYWVSAWKRKPDANPKAPSLSFSIKKKEVVHADGMDRMQKAVDNPPSMDGFDESSIPF